MSEKYQEVIKIFWKCYEQQHSKDIIESAMVSNPERFTDNSTMSPSQYVTVKNPCARKPPQQFYTHYNSNLRLMSAGFVLINQSAKQSELEACCGPVYQSDSSKQK